jgi:hypothetical protein
LYLNIYDPTAETVGFLHLASKNFVFKQTQTAKILALYANHANRNIWFQANSRLGTIGSKQTQTAKALLQAMPTETFEFKQTQCRVPMDLSNPDNKSPSTNHAIRNIWFQANSDRVSLI